MLHFESEGRCDEQTIVLFLQDQGICQATKAPVLDEELLRTGKDLAEGNGDSLGGNVWKKRLNKNMNCSIVVEKVGDHWFLVYLYVKNDREKID